MLFWVPVPEIAAALGDLPGATVQVVSPDGGPLPASADEVEFYVPPFFPAPPAIEVIAHLPGLRVVQALTAGIDRLLPYIQPGVTLCNARGVHDASTAEWVVATILAAVRDLPYFALEQAAHRWSYRYTDSLAGKIGPDRRVRVDRGRGGRNGWPGSRWRCAGSPGGHARAWPR